MYKLKIGILTSSWYNSQKILNNIYDNDKSVFEKSRGIDWCECDMIQYRVIPNNNHGMRFDQLIILDNEKENIDDELVNIFLSNSCVPCENQIIKM